MASAFGLIPESRSVDKLSVKSIVELQDAPVIIELGSSGGSLQRIGGKHLRMTVKTVSDGYTADWNLPKAVPGVKTTVFINPVKVDSETDDTALATSQTVNLLCTGQDKMYGVAISPTISSGGSADGSEDLYSTFVTGAGKLVFATDGTTSFKVGDSKATHATLECLVPGIWTIHSFGLFTFA